MIKYTIEKYDGHDLRESASKKNNDLTQDFIAEKVKSGESNIDIASFYPTNNFIVLTIGSSSVAIYQPQAWFLYFLYNNLSGAKKAIAFYIKRSYDIQERFAWANLNEELKTFIMAATLAGE